MPADKPKQAKTRIAGRFGHADFGTWRVVLLDSSVPGQAEGRLGEAELHVKKGEPLSESFVAHEKLYPILMGEMLLVGEETGKVAEMLGQTAEFYETDVGEKTKDLSTIIEPVLMLFIGVFVGIFAVSVIAPIYSLSSAF